MEESMEENTLYHISHLHPLNLTSLKREEEDPPKCHACRLPCSGGGEGEAYQCSPCRYTLHASCARLPQTLCHPSHPSHPLVLYLLPPYQDSSFVCDACGESSVAFCFHCSQCQFDLHLPCAALPEKLNHESHPHPLTLVYEDPYNGEGCICSLCEVTFDNSSQWLYLCEACDYGGHIDCFSAPHDDDDDDEEEDDNGDEDGRQPANSVESLLLAQRQLQNSMIQAKVAEITARSISNSIRGSNLFEERVTVYERRKHPSYSSMLSENNLMMLQSMAALAIDNNVDGTDDGGGKKKRNSKGKAKLSALKK